MGTHQTVIVINSGSPEDTLAALDAIKASIMDGDTTWEGRVPHKYSGAASFDHVPYRRLNTSNPVRLPALGDDSVAVKARGLALV